MRWGWVGYEKGLDIFKVKEEIAEIVDGNDFDVLDEGGLIEIVFGEKNSRKSSVFSLFD